MLKPKQQSFILEPLKIKLYLYMKQPELLQFKLELRSVKFELLTLQPE
jgi:hypothetical protein